MEKVLITGGKGLIGKNLSSLLTSKGYEVRILSRDPLPLKANKTFVWNIKKHYIDQDAFKNLDHIIHLAGEGIADKRWSKERKNELINSRVQSTNLLFKTIKRLEIPLKSFISASAIGYYGSITSETIFKETDRASSDFLGNLCQLWEESAFQFKKENIKTVVLRTGIVLAKNEGALKKMKTPVITPLGNGKQYMPWIHIVDLCKLYLMAIEDSNFEGIFNAVSTDHQSNISFSKKIAEIYRRPFLPTRIPEFVIKTIFGDMSIVVLRGSRVSAGKIKEAGFKFSFETLKNALEDLK